MAMIARVLSRAFPTTETQAEILKNIAMLGGAVLLVSVLLATYGLDLSAGFF